MQTIPHVSSISAKSLAGSKFIKNSMGKKLSLTNCLSWCRVAKFWTVNHLLKP